MGFSINNNTLLIGVVLVLAFLYFTSNAPNAPGAVGGGAGGAGGAAAIGCPTILSQTLSNVTYDIDKPTSGAANVLTVYTNAANGQVYPGGTATKQLGTYDALMTGSTSYFGTLVHLTTDCSSSPVATGYLKAVDTPSVTVYNTDGVTANADANNLSIGASGSGTAHLKMSQGTAYKHLSGESNKFAVFVNATNVTDWAPAQFSAVFDGVPCVAYGSGGLGNTAQPTVLGQTLVTAFVCTGDFAANDGSIHDLAVKLQAASGVNPGLETIGINYVGVDYYKDSVTGKVAMGAVTDTGAAIQTLRNAKVQIS